jgi:hypothetical protein
MENLIAIIIMGSVSSGAITTDDVTEMEYQQAEIDLVAMHEEQIVRLDIEREQFKFAFENEQKELMELLSTPEK